MKSKITSFFIFSILLSTSFFTVIDNLSGINSDQNLCITSNDTLIISQEDGPDSFNCALGACTLAQEITPQMNFNATKLGFLFGGSGNGTAIFSLRNSPDGLILATTEVIDILTNGTFTEGILTTQVELNAGILYYFQVNTNVPRTILFCLKLNNPYPYGIAYCKVSFGWTSDNPPNGDYAFRIYGSIDNSPVPTTTTDSSTLPSTSTTDSSTLPSTSTTNSSTIPTSEILPSTLSNITPGFTFISLILIIALLIYKRHPRI